MELAKAGKLTTFKEPLRFSDVKATARSVARWTYNRYDGKLTESSLAEAGMTPEAVPADDPCGRPLRLHYIAHSLTQRFQDRMRIV